MKALVLGGNGFIGSHVVDALLAAGHKVRVFDRGPEQFRAPLAEVDYRLADFNDVSALDEALEGIEVVYHLISTTVPSTSNLDPINDIQTNLVNTVRLLQVMVQRDLARIVYLSSGGTVYGIPQMLPISETHPLQPICSYGITKIAVEHYLAMFRHIHGLEYVALRASNPYGERQGHTGVQGVIGTFLNKVKRGEEIEVWGDGRIIRDYLYVQDLALLCVLSGEAKCVSDVFNAGSGRGHSIRDVLEAIESTVGKRLMIKYKSGRKFDVPEVVLDIARAEEVFSWSSQVTLIDGIRRTWAWMEKQSI